MYRMGNVSKAEDSRKVCFPKNVMFELKIS